MSSFKSMKGVKPKVENLLKNYPHLRDDDNKLIANLWWNEIPNDVDDVVKFLKYFSDGNLSSPESIRRMRQKLQEQNPNLRGKNYNLRHKESQQVKLNINNV